MRVPLILAVAVVANLGVEAPDTPATFLSGSIPSLSVTSVEVGGGEVLLEVSVDRSGAVTAIKPLRETATFTERMVQAVRTWHFTPAQTSIPEARRKPGEPTTEPVETKVLVAGIFRRPSAIGVTLGAPIKDVAAPSNDIPFPASIVTPAYPPGTMSPGVVLVEISLDASGGVTDATVRTSAAGFDSAALDAARKWTFRAARPAGGSAPTRAYVVFGFPVPKGW